MSESNIQPGTQLGNYKVISKLATGGMATVYLARRVDASPHSPPVALKAISVEMLDPEKLGQDRLVRMFVDEAMMSSRIHHPNVVRVMELLQDKGYYFLIMEYVEGCSLAELLGALQKERRWLSPESSVWIAAETASALHAAHETLSDEGTSLNLIHRDVSPQNILLSEKGEVKLTDFGVAKAVGRAERTKTGVVKGKYRYMSPEQLIAKDMNHLADLYALGVVLWEMLAARRLWHGLSDSEVMYQLRNPQIPKPSKYSKVDPELEAVVMKALSLKREDRFTNLDVFKKKLFEVFPSALGGGAEIPLLVSFAREMKKRKNETSVSSSVEVESILLSKPSSKIPPMKPVPSKVTMLDSKDKTIVDPLLGMNPLPDPPTKKSSRPPKGSEVQKHELYIDGESSSKNTNLFHKTLLDQMGKKTEGPFFETSIPELPREMHEDVPAAQSKLQLPQVRMSEVSLIVNSKNEDRVSPFHGAGFEVMPMPSSPGTLKKRNSFGSNLVRGIKWILVAMIVMVITFFACYFFNIQFPSFI